MMMVVEAATKSPCRPIADLPLNAKNTRHITGAMNQPHSQSELYSYCCGGGGGGCGGGGGGGNIEETASITTKNVY